MNQNDLTKRMRNMVNNGKNTRLNLSVDEVRHFNPRLATFILKDPLVALKMFQDSLNAHVKNMKDDGGTKSGNNEKVAAQQDNFPKKT